MKARKNKNREVLYDISINSINTIIDARMDKNKCVSKRYFENDEIEFIDSLIDIDISFAEKIYRIYYNALPPLCNCGKETTFRAFNKGYKRYCSKACFNASAEGKLNAANALVKARHTWHNMLPNCTPEYKQSIKDKAAHTISLKTPEENLAIRKKISNTMMERYGVEHYISLVYKIGVENSQKESAKEKRNNTNMKKYNGISPFACKSVRAKSTQTLIKRYGVDNCQKVDDISKKTSYTFKQNILKNKGLCNEEIQTVLSNLDDPQFWQNNILYLNSYLRQYYGEGTIYQHIKINRPELIRCNTTSYPELLLRSMLNENLIYNDRTLISPYEIDVYDPDNKIGYECHGAYWHSDIMKDNDYHETKGDMCESHNVYLFQFYANELINKTLLIKRTIDNAYGEFTEIDIAECVSNKNDTTFIDNNMINHIEYVDYLNVVKYDTVVMSYVYDGTYWHIIADPQYRYSNAGYFKAGLVNRRFNTLMFDNYKDKIGAISSNVLGYNVYDAGYYQL